MMTDMAAVASASPTPALKRRNQPHFLAVPALSSSSSASSSTSEGGPATPQQLISPAPTPAKSQVCKQDDAVDSLARGYREQVLRDQARRLESVLGLSQPLFPPTQPKTEQQFQEPFNIAAWSSAVPRPSSPASSSSSALPHEAFTYENIFDVLPDAIFVLSPVDGQILYASASLEAKLELDTSAAADPLFSITDNLVGTLLVQHCHPDDVLLVGRLLRSAGTSRGDQPDALSKSDEIIRLRKADGHFAAFDLRARCGFFDGASTGDFEDKTKKLIVCTARHRVLPHCPSTSVRCNGMTYSRTSAAALAPTVRLLVSADGLVLDVFGHEDVTRAFFKSAHGTVRGAHLDELCQKTESRQFLRAMLQIAIDSAQTQSGELRTEKLPLVSVLVVPCVFDDGRVPKAFIELSSPHVGQPSPAKTARTKRRCSASDALTPVDPHQLSEDRTFLSQESAFLASENKRLRQQLQLKLGPRVRASRAKRLPAAPRVMVPLDVQAQMVAVHQQQAMFHQMQMQALQQQQQQQLFHLLTAQHSQQAHFPPVQHIPAMASLAEVPVHEVMQTAWPAFPAPSGLCVNLGREASMPFTPSAMMPPPPPPVAMAPPLLAAAAGFPGFEPSSHLDMASYPGFPLMP